MHSRTLLGALIAVNVGLALVFAGAQSAPEPERASPAAFEDRLTLLKEAAPRPAEARQCRYWGPESTADALDALRSQLEADGAFPELIERQVHANPDFMVYVDAFDSPENARRYAQELARMEIESYTIQRDGGVILSVGVFSNPELAERQLDRVQSLGYAAEVEKLTRTQRVFGLRGYVSPASTLHASSTSACLDIAQQSASDR